MERTLSDRIQRGEAAIARAKAKGRDVSHWELHLDRLKQARELQKKADSSPELVKVPGDNTADDVATIFGVSPGWLYHTIKRPEKYSAGPIAVGPAETVMDVEKFVEVTIKDVIKAIHKQNHGHHHYWGISLIQEK